MHTNQKFDLFHVEKKDKIKQKVNKTHGKNNKISTRVLEKSASKRPAWKVKEIETYASSIQTHAHRERNHIHTRIKQKTD